MRTRSSRDLTLHGLVPVDGVREQLQNSARDAELTIGVLASRACSPPSFANR
jgi:hypothetical protein